MPSYQVFGEEKDDNFEGVILLEGDDTEKKTAEDFGSFWFIRDWEIMSLDGVNFWFCRSGYTLEKCLITKLTEVKNG